MKRFFLFFFLCVFAVNVTAATSMAAMPDKKTQTEEKAAEMPCHGQAQKQSENKSSNDDSCKCMHMCFAKVLFHNGNETAVSWPDAQGLWSIADVRLPSLAPEPLRRPPKTFS